MIISSQAGFTFNEVLAAMAIVLFAVMSYSLATITLNRRQVISDNSTVAINLARTNWKSCKRSGLSPTAISARPGAMKGYRRKAESAGFFSAAGKLPVRRSAWI